MLCVCSAELAMETQTERQRKGGGKEKKIVEEFRCVLVCDENKIGIGEREEEKWRIWMGNGSMSMARAIFHLFKPPKIPQWWNYIMISVTRLASRRSSSRARWNIKQQKEKKRKKGWKISNQMRKERRRCRWFRYEYENQHPSHASIIAGSLGWCLVIKLITNASAVSFDFISSNFDYFFLPLLAPCAFKVTFLWWLQGIWWRNKQEHGKKKNEKTESERREMK